MAVIYQALSKKMSAGLTAGTTNLEAPHVSFGELWAKRRGRYSSTPIHSLCSAMTKSDPKSSMQLKIIRLMQELFGNFSIEKVRN